ncbi:MAG: GNAT family N-acetyltransferase, partial [Anaerolineae bacterium]|nr:GNAT family N-acetyltransferase [Anaerolineae bacterium]
MSDPTNQLDIIIRGMDSEDWEDSAALLASGNVAYNTLQLPYMSRDYIRERAENVPRGLMMLAAEVEETVVGQLGLHRQFGRRAH